MSNQSQFGKKPRGLKGFTKSEKWTQYILWGGIAALGLVFWDRILPFLIRVTENTIHLLIAVGILGTIIFVITDPKVRALAKAAYMKAISSITRAFIKHDPIGIMRVYIQQLKGRQDEMEKSADHVAAEKGKLDRIIADQFEEMKSEAAKSKKATSLGEKGQAMVHQNQAGRLKTSNDKLKKMSDRMHKLQSFLKKLSKNTSLMIQDRENSLRTKELEYNTLKAGHKALSNATAIFNGKGSQKELYEEALKFLQEDMGAKMGQMDRYLEQSQEFMLKMDIESAMFDDEGAKVLDSMLDQDFTYLFEDPEDDFQRIAQGQVSADELLNNTSAEPELIKTTKATPIKNTNTKTKSSDNPYM
jgi:hypothetical protein